MLTLTPVILYLIFLLSLPTGNTSPARDDADLLLIIAAFPAFPAFPLLLDNIVAGFETVFGFTLLLELVATRGEGITADVVAAGLEILLVLTGTELVANVDRAGAGTGALLSNKASGTLETVNAIEELVYASFPLRSKVSNIVIVGKMENIFSL